MRLQDVGVGGFPVVSDHLHTVAISRNVAIVPKGCSLEDDFYVPDHMAFA
jgi:hypothetical protein